MISVENALQKVLICINILPLEKINILDACGRVIGDDILSPRNIPAADNSAMDGYAVCYMDIETAKETNPAILKIIEIIPAGKMPVKKIKKGEAARIMTGALIPEGADTIVRQEETAKDGRNVFILTPAKKGQDIRFAGEDVLAGELVIAQKTIIRPAHIGMLAALGHRFVRVHRRPRVAIMATGDELVDIRKNPSSAKIVNSNSYALAAQVAACGGIPLMLGIAKDKKSELKNKFKKALHADLIISSGGVSVGDFDYVKDVMSEMGNAMHFWQVAMRPGKPLVFGTIEGIPLFGLPGNPVSVMVSFEQFVRPAILKMQGHSKIFRQTIKAIIDQEIKVKNGIRHFIRAIVHKEKDKFYATSTGEQGSGILKSMVLANALIVLDENTVQVKKGGMVDVQLLDDSLFQF
jgi:molybdopterin molybdotransferase